MFALAWDRDDKFDRERLDAEHAADAQKPDFQNAYERAYETLDWQPLCRPGESPTLFWFRPVTGRTLHRLIDKDCGALEKSALAFRLGLRRIDNGPSGLDSLDPKLDRDYPDLGPMLGAKTFEQLSMFGYLVVALGNMVIARSSNLSPPR